MTKRFILTEQFVTLQGVTFVKDDNADVDTYYTVDGAVDLLNEQHETIGRLKQNIDELSSVDIEEELLKENEQLKTVINRYEKYSNKKNDELNFRQLDILKLKEENEKLKLLIKKVLETTPIKHSLAIDLKNSIRELYK